MDTQVYGLLPQREATVHPAPLLSQYGEIALLGLLAVGGLWGFTGRCVVNGTGMPSSLGHLIASARSSVGLLPLPQPPGLF